jgi:hypothetical protein
MGDSLTFTPKEKDTASHGQYTINYNGPVGNSQIQQDSRGSKQSMSIVQTDLKEVGDLSQISRVNFRSSP